MDTLTAEQRSERMSRVRGRNTKPERNFPPAQGPVRNILGINAWKRLPSCHLPSL